MQGSVKRRLSDLYSGSDEEDNYGLSKSRKRHKTNAINSSDSEDIDDPLATNSDADRSEFRIDNDQDLFVKEKISMEGKQNVSDLEISENNNTLPDLSPKAKRYRSKQTNHYEKKLQVAYEEQHYYSVAKVLGNDYDYKVFKQKTDDPYLVSFSEIEVICTCPDFKGRIETSNKNEVCKHICIVINKYFFTSKFPKNNCKK